LPARRPACSHPALIATGYQGDALQAGTWKRWKWGAALACVAAVVAWVAWPSSPPRRAAGPVEVPGLVAEEVRIGSGRGVLAGTLVLPRADGPVPAVVVIAGSGPADRSGRMRGFPAYAVIADHLARSGIAVLLLDRRGVGGSAGDWRYESIEDRADDALVALQWLRGRPEVDPARTGLLGHSQGGWVVQLAASRSRDVAFVVLMAGPGERVREQIITDERNEWLRTGHSAEEAEAHVRSLDRWMALIDALAPPCRALRLHTLCHVIEYDPAPALRRIHVPVLALFAERDTMVPPQPNRRLIEEGLREAGNHALTVREFPGANHQFWPAKTGARAEYGELVPGYVPGFLETLGEWIAAVPPAGSAGSSEAAAAP